MILEASTSNIQKAGLAIRAGYLVAFPTETVYGVGADAFNPTAVEAIYALKGRPSSNPLIVHIASLEWLPQLTGPLSAQQQQWLAKLTPLWPGPLSLVLPRNVSVPSIVSAGHPTIAIRMPRHTLAQEFLRASGTPVAAPSANRSNYISPTTAAHVQAEFGEALPIILDGGPCAVGIESTVLSLVGPIPKLLRLGSVSYSALQALLGEVEPPDTASTQTISPGMGAKHYSPRTALQYVGSSPAPGGKRMGLIRFDAQPVEATLKPEKICTLSEAGDPEEIACRLYAALRELDDLGLDLILVDRCARTGVGAAIMDRLDRAMAL